MKKSKSAKVTAVVFAIIIFTLVVNIVFLGATGKHLISGENIAEFARNRSKKEVVEYAQRGQIYTSDQEKVAVNVKNIKLFSFYLQVVQGMGKNLLMLKILVKQQVNWLLF